MLRRLRGARRVTEAVTTAEPDESQQAGFQVFNIVAWRAYRTAKQLDRGFQQTCCVGHAAQFGRLHQQGQQARFQREGVAAVGAGGDHGLDAGALEGAAGHIEDGVEVAFFEEFLAQADGGVVGVGEEGVLDDDAGAASGLEDLDEVLEEEEGGLAGADGEVLLHFLAFLAAERGIGQHHVEAVFFLDVGEVFGERVGVDDVGRFDAVQDHVHDRDDVGERLLLLAVEGALLQRFQVGRLAGLGAQVVVGLAQKAGRAAGAVVDALADPRGQHLDHGADERARRVVLAAVAPGVAHVLDLGFVQVRQLVLLGLRAEAQFVDVVDDLAQVVAAVNLVLDLAEDLADLVLDGVRPAGLLLEPMQIRKQLLIDEVAQVVARDAPEVAVDRLGEQCAGAREPRPVDMRTAWRLSRMRM